MLINYATAQSFYDLSAVWFRVVFAQLQSALPLYSAAPLAVMGASLQQQKHSLSFIPATFR